MSLWLLWLGSCYSFRYWQAIFDLDYGNRSCWCVCVCEEQSANNANTAYLSGNKDEIPASVFAASDDHRELISRCNKMLKYSSVKDKIKNAWHSVTDGSWQALCLNQYKWRCLFEKGQQAPVLPVLAPLTDQSDGVMRKASPQAQVIWA